MKNAMLRRGAFLDGLGGWFCGALGVRDGTSGSMSPICMKWEQNPQMHPTIIRHMAVSTASTTGTTKGTKHVCCDAYGVQIFPILSGIIYIFLVRLIYFAIFILFQIL